MMFEVDFQSPVHADGVTLLSRVSQGAGDTLPLEIWAKPLISGWRLLAKSPPTGSNAGVVQRAEATAALRRAGFRYILAPVGSSGYGVVGSDMLRMPAEWGLDDIARVPTAALFRIR